MFPLSLAVSSLNLGANEIVIVLEGSGGSQATARFTVTLGKHIVVAWVSWFYTFIIHRFYGTTNHSTKWVMTLWPAVIMWPLHYSYSNVIAALGFTPSCTGEFNDDNSVFTITCVTPDGSQTIAEATYSVNGNDMGAGNLWKLKCLVISYHRVTDVITLLLSLLLYFG